MDETTTAPRGWPRSKPWPGAGWLSIEQARQTPGIRISDSPYWGAWWAQALRGILFVKELPYLKVVHPPFSETDPHAQDELFAWTAQTSVPTLVCTIDGKEVIRNDWLNQLMTLEQIQPLPALLPPDADDRVKMIGLAHEIMSPQGFMWNARLVMSASFATHSMSAKQRDFFGDKAFLGGKYAHNGKARTPLENTRQCLALLDRCLHENQQRSGTPYFVGSQLSALDIYWAYASNFVAILPHEQLPVMTFNRDMYPAINALLGEAVSPRLMEHRDNIFTQHLQLPVVVD